MGDVAPSEREPNKPPGRVTPTAEGILRLHGANVERAARVVRLAADLFHSTSAAHGLPTEDLEVVRTAACLHDLGAGATGPTQAAQLVLQHGIAGLEAADVAVVAGAVGSLGGLVAAPDDDGRAARICALVAIAAALDDDGAIDTQVAHVDDTRRALRVYVGPPAFAGSVKSANAASAASDQTLRRPMRLAADGGSRYYIRPGDTMQATAYKIAARLYSEVRAREPGVRRDADIEDLHKFRVATRRLRAALRAFRPVFGRAVLRDAAASTRAVARATNAARDLDVFIEALEEDDFTTRVPTLMAHISGDRTVAIRGTVDTLDGDAYDDLIRATESLLVQIHPQTHAVERRRALRRVRDEAPRMIGIRLRRVLAYADGLAADDDERMHDLRIAIKQLRYVLEFVRDILPDDADKAVNELKALQDSLGDLNDCAVQRVYVAAHTSDAESQANMSEVERVTLELLAVRIELRRERALARFLEEWNGFIDADRQRLLAFRLGL